MQYQLHHADNDQREYQHEADAEEDEVACLALAEVTLSGLVALNAQSAEQDGADHLAKAQSSAGGKLGLGRAAVGGAVVVIVVVAHRGSSWWSSEANSGPALALPEYGKDRRCEGAVQALQQPDCQQPAAEHGAEQVGAGQKQQPLAAQVDPHHRATGTGTEQRLGQHQSGGVKGHAESGDAQWPAAEGKQLRVLGKELEYRLRRQPERQAEQEQQQRRYLDHIP